MDRAKYLQMRKSGQYDLAWFYQYYLKNKDESKGLARWFAEDWKNQRGEVGYTAKGDIYRPSHRINELTPTTWSELTTQEIKAAKKEKAKTGRVRRFKK